MTVRGEGFLVGLPAGPGGGWRWVTLAGGCGAGGGGGAGWVGGGRGGGWVGGGGGRGGGELPVGAVRLAELRSRFAGRVPAPVAVRPEWPLVVLPSSGTTSARPKLCLHS